MVGGTRRIDNGNGGAQPTSRCIRLLSEAGRANVRPMPSDWPEYPSHELMAPYPRNSLGTMPRRPVSPSRRSHPSGAGSPRGTVSPQWSDLKSDRPGCSALRDTAGRLLGSREFDADRAGYQRMLDWMTSFGRLSGVGVEGTGSYGAGLTRHLRNAGIAVVEVNRPDRSTRRQRGKSDPIDAESAARAVLSGQATGTPKDSSGAVEAIRVLRVARGGAVKARTAALNQLKDLIVTAPEQVRGQLHGLPLHRAARRCARMNRPGFSGDPDCWFRPWRGRVSQDSPGSAWSSG